MAVTRRAGGLHGVGASVVNALSKELVATVKRRRRAVGDAFQAGQTRRSVKKARPARGTGTTVYFHPDAAIFPKIEFDPAIIKERLEVVSYLHKGVEGYLRRRDLRRKRSVFEHSEGARRSISRRSCPSEAAKPIHEAPFVLRER